MMIKPFAIVVGSWFTSTMIAQAASGNVEEALKGAASQVPALVVLVVVVWFFLGAMKDSRTEYLSSIKSMAEAHQSQWNAVHQDNMQNRSDMQRMLERQISAMEKHTEAMVAMAKAVDRCPRKGD